MAGRSFTDRSAKRIAEAVRRVERQTEPGWRPRWNSDPPIPFEFCRFELSAALSAGGPAAAYRRLYDYAERDYRTRTDMPAIEVYDVSSRLLAAAGCRGYAIRSQDTPGGRWEILAIDSGLMRFTLTEALTAGDTATAVARRWEDDEYVGEENVEITVRDSGSCRAAPDGTTGLAWHPPDTDEWEVVALDLKAAMITFTVDEEFDTADDEVDATLVLYWDGANPDPETAGLTLRNTSHIFAGAEGAAGIARYNPSADQYQIIQMECP